METAVCECATGNKEHSFFLKDPVFYGAFLLGGLAWVLPEQQVRIAWHILLWKAVLEECVFRFGLQGWLTGFVWSRRFPLPGISWANVATSLLFVAVHVMHHPPLWAMAVFFPSLIFGWAFDRYNTICAPIVLHFSYNVFLLGAWT